MVLHSKILTSGTLFEDSFLRGTPGGGTSFEDSFLCGTLAGDTSFEDFLCGTSFFKDPFLRGTPGGGTSLEDHFLCGISFEVLFLFTCVPVSSSERSTSRNLCSNVRRVLFAESLIFFC